MQRHVRECAAPAVRGAPAAAAWNRAVRELDIRAQESPPRPLPVQTKIRAQLHPLRPPEPLRQPTHFFDNAACAVVFPAAAVSPPMEKARTQTEPSQCSTLRFESVATI